VTLGPPRHARILQTGGWAGCHIFYFAKSRSRLPTFPHPPRPIRVPKSISQSAEPLGWSRPATKRQRPSPTSFFFHQPLLSHTHPQQSIRDPSTTSVTHFCKSHSRFPHSAKMPPKSADKKPASKAPATASKAPEKKDAGKKTAATGDKKKRTKARKETYSSYIYKGESHCILFACWTRISTRRAFGPKTRFGPLSR